MDGSSALGMFLLIFRHISSRWLMGIFNKLLCNDSYCKLRKKRGGMVCRVIVDSRKEGHSPAVHHRSASWDTCTAPLSLTCHCRVLKTDRFCAHPPVTSHQNTCLLAAGCRLSTRSRVSTWLELWKRPIAELTCVLLQLRLISHHAVLSWCIM